MGPTVTAFLGVITAFAIILVLAQLRSAHLQKRFGPEYDRALEETGSKYRAEATLERLEMRVKMLSIRSLRFDERDHYRQRWKAIQARFVDYPDVVLEEADEIIEEVMATCGYPSTGFEDRATQLSVDHPLVVENYRKGHEIAEHQALGQASTEEIRQGLLHYRALFEDLMGGRARREPLAPPIGGRSATAAAHLR